MPKHLEIAAAAAGEMEVEEMAAVEVSAAVVVAAVVSEVVMVVDTEDAVGDMTVLARRGAIRRRFERTTEFSFQICRHVSAGRS